MPVMLKRRWFPRIESTRYNGKNLKGFNLFFPHFFLRNDRPLCYSFRLHVQELDTQNAVVVQVTYSEFLYDG